MKKDYLVTLMTDKVDGDDYIHISGVNCYHTLCGYCDVQGVKNVLASETGTPNCPGCLEVLKACRAYTRTMIPT